ncbi:MAG: tRNA (adenosine(37)-N6)-threonylcarbamoyltransferase complex dimerization subunit type 1 TsaB [Myxococcota bacterium]
MQVLALETSASSGSIALYGATGLIAEQDFAVARNHAAELAPRVRAMLADHGGLPAITGYAVSIGPGSFTGLRIGVAFLKGLAAVVPRPAVGVSSLQAMAVQALEKTQASTAVAVLDARQGDVFAGAYQADGTPHPGWPDGLFEGSQAVARVSSLATTPSTWRAVGDRTLEWPSDIEWVPAEHAVPAAATIGRLGARALALGLGVDAGTLDPAYHQRSAAEVNLGVQTSDRAGLNLG